MKKKKSYTKLMTNKNKSYYCYICNKNTVSWNGTNFVCSNCGAIHTSEGHQ